MKSTIKSILLICTIQLALTQVNTTTIQCQDAFRHVYYEENVFTGAGGDEEGIIVINSPDWADVDIVMNDYWSNDVIIRGTPTFVSDYQIIIGIVDYNFWIDEFMIYELVILEISVQFPSCDDPESCNYDPTPCLGTNSCNCFYDVECYIDPCVVTTCSNYPNADCVVDYCGGCFAHYYEDGIEVDCNEPPTCYSDDDCPNSSLCVTSTGDCNMSESLGFCVEQADYLCDDSYMPVCGCDGNNYSNPCEANYMSFMGINYFGECVVEYCDPLYDTNGDGVVNVLDIIQVLNYILYSEELSCSIYNNDGTMNVLDIVIMVNIILGIEG